ncbi:MAG TPA: glycosyltransferase family 4 protein [Pyrinomonadaceae bacterium]|jgi:glycosyltransferase involved in cell wall biosynthesis
MVLLAHPGTQYSHQLARQLVRYDSLYQFWTGFALATSGLVGRVVSNYAPTEWRRKIANRVVSGIPARSLHTMPVIELKALNRLRQGESPQRVFHERNLAFQERIPAASLNNASAIIGFDTSSWLLAERAEKMGKPYFLDQSISHPLFNQQIMERVARIFPDWQEEIEARLPEVLACEQREHQLATRIIAASSFSKQTLIAQGVAADKITVNPYGVDLELFYPPPTPRARQPVRFLFVGSISARKGVPLLVEAWRKMKLENAELWFVGPASERERALIPELPGLRFIGKRPHQELPDLLRQCDVLVFPSYCEGFGLVLLEALASGMPIITTEATAGPDLIEDGIEGYLIPSGNLDALSAAMRDCASEPERLESMALAARRSAERFSWDAYGERWQQILRDFA